MAGCTAVAGRTKRTLGGGEVDDVAIGLEHVDLLDSLDGLGAELLQGLLKLLVVGAGTGGRTLDLSPGSTLSTIRRHMLAGIVHTSCPSSLFALSCRTKVRRFVVRDIPWETVLVQYSYQIIIFTQNPRRTNSGTLAELLEALLNVLHCCAGGYVKVRGGGFRR